MRTRKEISTREGTRKKVDLFTADAKGEGVRFFVLRNIYEQKKSVGWKLESRSKEVV